MMPRARSPLLPVATGILRHDGGRMRTGPRSMRTLVVSPSLLDPVNNRLRDLLIKRVDPQGPAVARFEDAERQLAQMPADMTIVALSASPERGLEVLARLRRQM